MKYFMLIADGMADWVAPALQGKTPVEAARTPNLDRIARFGKLGTVRTIPPGLRPDSEVAALSLLGYDPKVHAAGRAPLEAAGLGVPLGPEDLAFVCSLVTVDENILADYAAGHIGSTEGALLIEFLQMHLSSKHVRFVPGAAFRHFMIYNGHEPIPIPTVPPHDLIGKDFPSALPHGEGSQILRRLILGSRDLLSKHEVNAVRTDLGENPANMIWLWGQGRRVTLEPFKKRFGKSGVMITASPLYRGVAQCIGWDVIPVHGTAGQIDSDYTAKTKAAVEALEKYNLVVVHVAATDIASHDGDVLRKVVAIENIDEKILGPMLHALEKNPKHRILVAASHFAPVSTRSHASDPPPFAVYGTGVRAIREAPFTEASARASDLHIEEGCSLMEYFLHEEQILRKRELPRHPPV